MSTESPGSQPRSMAVFVGASAGGVETIAELLSYLPVGFPAPVLVVLHITARGKDLLASILDRAGPLPAVTAVEGQTIKPGVVYVAPRDRHVLVHEGVIALSDGPAEHGVRPAIDPLFRSAARGYGPGAVGVVLSGMLDDGTSGLGEIRRAGGRALVQDPAEALYPQMPTSAIAHVDVNWVLPIDQIAAKLKELAGSPPTVSAPSAGSPSEGLVRPAEERHPVEGMRTDLTCPRCGSSLWETSDQGEMSYRCGAGHGYSAATLLTSQGEGLEDAIWQPIRLLHQRGALQRRLGELAERQGRDGSARYFFEQSRAALARAEELRRLVTAQVPPTDTDHGEDTDR